MIFVSKIRSIIGSNAFYAEEQPQHLEDIDAFWIDACAVSNTDFEKFVEATGYKTTAEIPLGGDADEPGSLVFRMSNGPVPLDDPRKWWEIVPGACWRYPEGPNSSIEGRLDHPVMHVSYFDALAYAGWVGKSLPNEKQWEVAARSGKQTEYPWGTALQPERNVLANTWKGEFPWQHVSVTNGIFTCPVNAYEPSEYGLYNMIDNVWEWTSSRFLGPHQPERGCCAPTFDIRGSDRMTLKGGSFLCSPSYCERYRPAARSPQEASVSASHIGFRCASNQTPVQG